MKFDWEEKSDVSRIFRVIEQYLKVSTGGGVSYHMEAISLIDIAFESIRVDLDVDKDAFYDDFQKVLFETFKERSKIEPKVVLAKLSGLYRDFLTEMKTYNFISTISLPSGFFPKKRRFLGCSISYLTTLGLAISKARKSAIEKNIDIKFGDDNECTYIKITLKALDPVAAYEKAEKVLCVIRGLWQLDFRKSINFLDPDKRRRYHVEPVIKRGEVCTIHDERGNVVESDRYIALWRDNGFSYTGEVKIRNLSRMENNFERRLKSLRKSSMSEFVTECVVSYISALDAPIDEYKFLMLNATLELLVDSDDTKTIQKRVSFFDRDGEKAKILIGGIRSIRNKSVHKGYKSKSLEIKILKLSLYIEYIIDFLLINGFRFSSKSEYVNFISSSTELDVVNEEIRRLKLVKKWLGN